MTNQNYKGPSANGEGYFDPTAGEAIRRADRIPYEESARFHKLIEVILHIVKLSGFEIQGRIVLKDTKTGRIWR